MTAAQLNSAPRLAEPGSSPAVATPMAIELPSPLTIIAAAIPPHMVAALQTALCGRRIERAASLADVLARMQARPPIDLMILGCGLNGLNGACGVEQLHELDSRARIVLVCAANRCRRDEAITGLRAGAASMIPDSLSAAALRCVLQLVLCGERFVPPEVLAEIDGEAGEPGQAARLSNREEQVAALLAKGLTNKEIARQLRLQEVTVKVHVSGVFRKLGVRNRTAAVAQLLAMHMV